MKMATEKIYIQIDNDKIELTGADKEAFIAQRESDNVQSQLREAEYKAKQDARDSAIKKLGSIYGQDVTDIQTELEAEQFQGLASQRRKKLEQTEQATFAGRSGTSIVTFTTPTPEWTNSTGQQSKQCSAVTIGGFNGLNN